MLTISKSQSEAINTLDRQRTDGGLGTTFDGTDYLCRDVRGDHLYPEYQEILATARPHGICTPRQARLALAQADLLTAVEAWMETAPASVRIEWEYANEIRRDWPPIADAATALGLTEAQLDDLFALAATL